MVGELGRVKLLTSQVRCEQNEEKTHNPFQRHSPQCSKDLPLEAPQSFTASQQCLTEDQTINKCSFGECWSHQL
jgi:hypothetical protein